MTKRGAALLSALSVVLGGCFATRNDVRLLQADVLAFRAEAHRTDSVRARQLVQIATGMNAALSGIADSAREASLRIDRLRGDSRTEMFAIQQQLLQLMEVSGQGQRRMNELRQALEERQQAAALPVAASAAPGDTTKPPAAVPPAPGQAQLYQQARDQMSRGSYGAARAGFEELLRLYPSSDLAADAQRFIAEAYAAEGNVAASDAAYTEVLTKYSRSASAPTALYKLGLSLARQGKRPEARASMDKLAREYPQSDEAELARDWLRSNR